MKIGIKNSIPHIRLKKRSFIKMFMVILCAVLIITGIKSCAERKNKLRDYVFEEISAQFEPIITPVYLQMKPGKQLNTKLIYSVYITEFDKGKSINNKIGIRLTRCFYTINENSGILPLEDTQNIFNNIEKEFNIKINEEERRKIVELSYYLPPGSLNSAFMLKRGLKSGEKTNIGLVNFAWNALSCGSGYVYGAVGNTINPPYLIKQQRRFNGNQRANMGKEQTDYIFLNFGGRPGFDCCGLIKAYSWFNENTGKIVPGTPNTIKDCTADGLYDTAQVKGNISQMPDTPGIAVHKKGHVGIYIGGGEVIEAKGNNFGVVKTKLIGRGWEHYFKVPTLTYVQSGTFNFNDRRFTLYEGKIVNKNEF